MWWRTLLAVWAVLPAGATFYFWVFWRHFDYWRKRRYVIGAIALATFGAIAAVTLLFRRWILAGGIAMPLWVQAIGWALIATVGVFGTVADRQIGIRVRSFLPFFDRAGHIDLKTTGAYGVVRHPIYAAGSGFQLGTFLVTGYPAVLVAWVVLTAGALWFTHQEEERLMTLLADPNEYVRYRERVPALFPRFLRR